MTEYIKRKWNVMNPFQRTTLLVMLVVPALVIAISLALATEEDFDGDGIPDSWEDANGLNRLNYWDGQEDPDEDGLTNLQEYIYDTDPWEWDTDVDAFSDYAELFLYGTDPQDELSCAMRIRQLACGDAHTLYLTGDGLVWSWGKNVSGRLGIGTSGGVSETPTNVHGAGDIGYLSNVVAVAAGSAHSMALKNDGTVWTWGEGSSGCLGDNGTADQTTPVQVHGTNDVGHLSNIVAIAAGEAHSIALSVDGAVYAWGENSSGQLGDGTTTDRLTPVQVLGTNGVGYLTAIITIAAGDEHNLAAGLEGTVYTWGNNVDGRLGDNTTTDRTTPVQVHGTNDVGYLNEIVAIAAGAGHSLALSYAGELYSWGDNKNGQLGDNTSTDRHTPVQVHGTNDVGYLLDALVISAGDNYSVAVKYDRTAFAWGINNNGQLGDGTTTKSFTPVQVHGSNDVGYLTEVVDIDAGTKHNMALRSDGTLWGWGNNGSYRLGDGTTTTRLTPVQITANWPEKDIDGDGMPDAWEAEYFGHLERTGLDDADSDGLIDVDEYTNGTDPTTTDSDGDALSDGDEINVYSTDPLDMDSDGDTLWDGYEVHIYGTSPTSTDSDSDTLPDRWEVRHGMNGASVDSRGADPDADGLTNGYEEALWINPLHFDSDGDSMPDGWESTYGLSPADGVSTSLVAWWRFDESSGLVAYDDNWIWMNDGLLVNGAGRTGEGHTRHGLVLDGDDDFVLVEDHPSLDSTDGLTVSLWAKITAFDTTNQPVYFISKEDASGHMEYALSYIKSTQSLRLSHKNAGEQSEVVSVTCDLTTDVWTHLAVAVSGSNVSFFTNGVQVGSAQTLSYVRSNLGDILIGTTASTNAVDPTVHGVLDEVRIYDVALAQSQVEDMLEGEGDSDADGLTNVEEYRYGTNPGTDDTVTDNDSDGLSNYVEIKIYGTDPFNPDTDGDGANDGAEITAGTDPLVADQYPTPGPAVTIISPKNGQIIGR